MIRAIAILTLLSACTTGSGNYRIELSASAKAVGMTDERARKAVEILIQELDGIYPTGKPREILGLYFRIRVDVVPEPFLCGTVLASGCSYDGLIKMVVSPTPHACIADTSYLHEVAHHLLCQTMPGDSTLGRPGCDGEHDAVVVWDAVRRANKRLKAVDCPTPGAITQP